MKKSNSSNKSSDHGHSPAASPVSAVLVVEIKAEVQQSIRRHARSTLDEEICGMLIGVVKEGVTLVENIIAGEGARQAGTHVTFTQEAWAHVYEVKDSKYPDKRIVGWYHSHPGFGIFLSDHDLFIHKNFFSDPNQIAWVFDPHSDEEGCFVWQGGEIVRLQKLHVQNQAGHATEAPLPKQQASAHTAHPASPAPSRSFPNITKWTALTLSHLFVLVVGFLVCLFLLGPEIIEVPVPARATRTQPDKSIPAKQTPVPEYGKESSK